MAPFNQSLWKMVVFLFLSKYVKEANIPFPQKELINDKNIDLASRFVEMVGDTTEVKKIKFALLKALRQLEKEELVLRLNEETLQLSDAGIAKMKAEVKTAMAKITQSFPESVAKDKPSPTVQ